MEKAAVMAGSCNAKPWHRSRGSFLLGRAAIYTADSDDSFLSAEYTFDSSFGVGQKMRTWTERYRLDY